MGTSYGFTDSLSSQVSMTTYPNVTSSGWTDIPRNGCVELSASSLNPCDSSDNLVSRSTRLVLDDVVYIGLMPLLTLVGVGTNVINMAVFFTQGLGDRVRLCLFSLSLADLLSLTSLSLRYMSKTLVYVISPSWAYNVWMTSLMTYRVLFVHAGFQLVTNFISIVIAVDRGICVAWPLRAARALSTRKTCVVISVFSVLVFAGNQFVAFKYDVTCAYIKGVKTRPLLYAVPSKVYQSNPILMETLDSFVFSSLVPTLSVLITATATIFTAIKLRRAAVWRERSTKGGGADVINQREKALTSMLVAVSCVFIVCVSPRVVRAWCRFFFLEFRAWGRWCGLLLMTEALMNVLLAVNSTVNFFVYYTMGSRFRSTLHQLMARCR